MSTPKLIQRWHHFCQDITSPDSYIDIGFYFMISSALQRRVWLQSPDFAIFPNLYVLLIGPPAVGKGLVIGQVNEALRFWKLPKKGGIPEDQQVLIEDTLTKIENLNMLMQQYGVSNIGGPPKPNIKPGLEEKLIFPVSADSTTYEALMKEAANCIRTHKLPDGVTHQQMAPKGVYMHQSIVFCLEELSSLFRKKVEDIGKYLLNAYDCKYYKYVTKTGGEDAIIKPCTNLIAATTPDFMDDAQSQKMIGDGLLSRFITVFEPDNRFDVFDYRPVDAAQAESRMEVLKRLKFLSTLFGQLEFTPEALEYMRDWFKTPENNHIVKYKRERLNRNPKLDSYYGRKKLHAEKLAIAIHFADKDSMVIDLEDCTMAMAFLHRIEPKMHMAFQYGGLNPFAGLYKFIERYIATTDGATFNEIWSNFAEDVQKPDLEGILNFLCETGKIQCKDGKYRKR